MRESCNRALYGWPVWTTRVTEFEGRVAVEVTPCSGRIESDYAPGTFYPCVDCNPNWARLRADSYKETASDD